MRWRRHARSATGAFSGAPIWGHEQCEARAKLGWRRHVRSATGAFGGAPYGSAKRVRGVPK
eukprot:1410093-Pyramimonas_sp.AAC.1